MQYIEECEEARLQSPLIWVISIVTLLITNSITTHEPASRVDGRRRFLDLSSALLTIAGTGFYWKSKDALCLHGWVGLNMIDAGTKSKEGPSEPPEDTDASLHALSEKGLTDHVAVSPLQPTTPKPICRPHLSPRPRNCFPKFDVRKKLMVYGLSICKSASNKTRRFVQPMGPAKSRDPLIRDFRTCVLLNFAANFVKHWHDTRVYFIRYPYRQPL